MACAWRADLGRVPYGAAWALQKALVKRRTAGLIPDVILFLEHDPVVTLGRAAREERPNPAGVPVFEVERGGGLTCHGPGQLVGYPILALPLARRDVHRYLRDLEEVLLRALARFGIPGRRRAGWTGVWCGEHKVASIGVALSRWVTFHGFALNVTNDLAAFQGLRPCGLPAGVMTSMSALLGEPLAVGPVTEAVAEEMARVFDLELSRVRRSDLGAPEEALQSGGNTPPCVLG
jgi:lipoate-protein ligase B